MGDATFTFRVDEDLKSQFADAARSGDRTSAQVLRAFMRDFVRSRDHDAWFRDQVRIGREAADAGDLTSHEEVEAEAAAWRAGIGS